MVRETTEASYEGETVSREFLPYRGVGRLKLGMSEEDVRTILGTPIAETRSVLGERELFYDDFRVALSREHERVVEIACESSSRVTFEGVDVLGDPDGFRLLMERDGKPMLCGGLVVLLNLGVALSGVDERTEPTRSITIFERGRFDRFEGMMRALDVVL